MLYEFTNVTMPTQLVIEAEVQYVSGNAANECRSGVAIAFTTGYEQGGELCVERGDIFLTQRGCTRGSQAQVNTDDTNHLYRIEVDNPTVLGSLISVYQDGTLVMTGVVSQDSDTWGPTPDVWFGDGSLSAYGTSRWRSFYHNAATVPSKAVVFIRSTPDEIAWTSHSNALYNVQYCPDFNGTPWTDVFTNILGNGGTNRVSDAAVRTNQHGFYRIEMVQ
jgi:hypothetical protein